MEKVLDAEFGTKLLSTMAAPDAIRIAAKHATRKLRIVIFLQDSRRLFSMESRTSESGDDCCRYPSSTPTTRLLSRSTTSTLPPARMKAVPLNPGNFTVRASGIAVSPCRATVEGISAPTTA